MAIHGSQPDVDAALDQARQLTEPVGTDGRWIRRQAHWANTYAGRFDTYLLSDDKAKGVVAWLRQQNYSPAAGREL